jgi:Fur family transcriptional regulator, ferric uptake regulator
VLTARLASLDDVEEPKTTELVNELRARGHRVTTTRQAVWSVLQATERHLTVHEIMGATAAAGYPVGLASVYRTLDLFEELGFARRSQLSDGDAGRWEVAHADENFHMACAHCGAVDHHVGSLVGTIEEHLQQRHGFEVYAVDLRVIGRCPRCRGGRGSE